MAARDKKQRRSSSAATERHQGGAPRGRDPTCLGHIEGSAGGGGGVQSLLDLAINPSPWGAFVGGPPTTAVKTSFNKKRPSSAPRSTSVTRTLTPDQSPLSGFEAGGGGKGVQARPKSAHAAYPSRTNASEALVARACNVPERRLLSPPAVLGNEKDLSDSKSRSSLSGCPVSAVGERLEEAGGADSERQRQASRARACTGSRQQRTSVGDAELVVIARQVQAGTVCSEAKAAVDEVSETSSSGLCCRKNEVQELPVLALCFVQLENAPGTRSKTRQYEARPAVVANSRICVSPSLSSIIEEVQPRDCSCFSAFRRPRNTLGYPVAAFPCAADTTNTTIAAATATATAVTSTTLPRAFFAVAIGAEQ